MALAGLDKMKRCSSSSDEWFNLADLDIMRCSPPGDDVHVIARNATISTEFLRDPLFREDDVF